VRFALQELPPTDTIDAPRGNPPEAGPGQHAFLPSRRYFLTAAGAGAGLALVGYSGVDSLLLPPDRGSLWSEVCIRPPGALPEPAFLDRCLRCGQCMKVCPTNGLQPSWFAAGAEGMFSPILVARRGPCEPDCHACGAVCPTGAIHNLPLEEKRWAKIGTAVVEPGYCLAWAENRACVVCEEVCPYGAIKCEQRPGAVAPVPVVKAERCYGCGYCEQHCPVRLPAIVVRPLNALRLTGTNYQETAQGIGLTLIPASKNPEPKSFSEELPEDALPPGFTD
jgi:MauM/NapG family ferredoxin protein